LLKPNLNEHLNNKHLMVAANLQQLSTVKVQKGVALSPFGNVLSPSYCLCHNKSMKIHACVIMASFCL